MCRAVTCDTCGKTTWAGCGQHIDAVKRTVPDGQWCDGNHGGTGAAGDQKASEGGFLSRILGR